MSILGLLVFFGAFYGLFEPVFLAERNYSPTFCHVTNVQRGAAVFSGALVSIEYEMPHRGVAQDSVFGAGSRRVKASRMMTSEKSKDYFLGSTHRCWYAPLNPRELLFEFEYQSGSIGFLISISAMFLSTIPAFLTVVLALYAKAKLYRPFLNASNLVMWKVRWLCRLFCCCFRARLAGNLPRTTMNVIHRH